MVFLELIGVVARSPIHVKQEEVIVIWTLTVMEALNAVEIIAGKIFHRQEATGLVLLIAV